MILLSVLSMAHSAHALDLAMPKIVRGDQVTFAVSGATPGDEVLLAMGKAGAGPCPGQIDPLCLDVKSPKLLGSAIAAADGTADITLLVPNGAPLVVRSFQAVSTGAVPDKSPAYPAQVWNVRTSPWSVSTEDDLALLEVTARIDGYLSFSLGAGETYNVELPGLDEVDDIRTGPSCGIVRLSLPALPAISGAAITSINTSSCDTLRVLRADVLTSTPGTLILGGASLVDVQLPALVDAGGGGVRMYASSLASVDLSSLESASYVEVAESSLLELDLPQLTGTSNIIVASSPSLQTVTAPLVQAGDLTLRDLPSLQSVSAPMLATTSRLQIRQTGLASVSLPALTTATTSVNIASNPALASFSAPLGYSTGSADVRSNPALPDCQTEALFSSWRTFFCIDNLADACTADGPGCF